MNLSKLIVLMAPGIATHGDNAVARGPRKVVQMAVPAAKKNTATPLKNT
jgi:hypothetical protein